MTIVVMLSDRYWSGKRWSKDSSDAKLFLTFGGAWRYVDEVFSSLPYHEYVFLKRL